MKIHVAHRFSVLSLALLAGAGCVNLELGKPLDPARLPDIQSGRTKYQQVVEWYGPPNRVAEAEGIKVTTHRYLTPEGTHHYLVVSFKDDVVQAVSANPENWR